MPCLRVLCLRAELNRTPKCLQEIDDDNIITKEAVIGSLIPDVSDCAKKKVPFSDLRDGGPAKQMNREPVVVVSDSGSP